MFETIRKFSLAYCDYPTMLWNVSFFLRTLSLNVDPRNRKPIPIIVTMLNVVFTASYCYVYLISMIWFVFWKCKETGDLVLALIIFSLGASSQMGPYKLLSMFMHRDSLNQIVEQCLANDALVEPESRFSFNLLKALRGVKKRAMIFWSVIIGNGVVYIMKPILLPGRHLMEDLFILYGLEPIFETPNYEIIFLLSAMGVCFTVYTPSNATSFQIITVGYLEAQMIAWSEELIHIWEDAKEYYSKQIRIATNEIINDCRQKNIIVNRFVNQRLTCIVKAHANNLNLFRNIEYFFKGAIAVEFTLLIVCLIAELLGGLENTYLQVPFALMQVGMDCFIGQRLLDAGAVFQRAVYDCKWENFNKENMKVVLLMIIISQKSMSITAGGMTQLSFVSLMAIVKSVYSAYTTLNGK